MSNDIYLIPKDELYHYGVKGMKWGVRKERYTSEAGRRYSSAKKNRKAARNNYLAAYNDAADYEVYHPSDKSSKGHKRAETNRRWADAKAKEEAYKTAKEEYKNSKKKSTNSLTNTQLRESKLCRRLLLMLLSQLQCMGTIN